MHKANCGKWLVGFNLVSVLKYPLSYSKSAESTFMDYCAYCQLKSFSIYVRGLQ